MQVMELFTYGTLMFPKIWETVVGKGATALDAQPASLAGYEIRRFSGHEFPGIFESRRDVTPVPGTVYSGLSTGQMDALDRYEDSAYFRDVVTVRLETGETLEAQTYVVREAHRHRLSTDGWTAQWFEENAYETYFSGLTGDPMPR